MNRTDKVGIINFMLMVKGEFSLNDLKDKFKFSRRTLSYCIADLNYYHIFESDVTRIIIYVPNDNITSDYVYKLCDAKTIKGMMELYFKQLGKSPNENEIIKYYERLLKNKTHWLHFLRKTNLISEKSYLDLIDDDISTKEMNVKQIRMLKLITQLEKMPSLCMKSFMQKENIKLEKTIYNYLISVDLYLSDTEQTDKEVRWNSITKRAKICYKNFPNDDNNTWKYIR